ncbi:hypothetical protein F5887DRAFT_1076559 [Amanita rubescens]|nr:hypothetical protein F5887DRAFT_1076559 [Amanita rubescens]
MHLGDLPLEIQSYILQFCSPNDLAILSRTHTSLRDAAEYVLYGRIDIYGARPYDLILLDYDPSIPNPPDHDISPQGLNEHKSPLHTLITNSRKASIVKAFYVDFAHVYDGVLDVNSVAMDFVAEKLGEALEKMTALVDLRIRHDETVDLCGRRIDQAIRGGYFKLNSLCLEGFHDIDGIVAGQPHLQLVGIFCQVSGPNTHLLETLERLSQTPSHRRTLPSFFLLDYRLKPVIFMLPFLYHLGEVPKVCRETVTLINKWPNFHGNLRYGLGISLFGISEKNMNLVEKTMVAMMASLRGCQSYESAMNIEVIVYEKYIQNPWQFPAFFEPIVYFKHLYSLTFFMVDLNDYQKLRQMTNDLESCLLAKGLAWGHMKWPNLQRITLWRDLSAGYSWQSNIIIIPSSSRWYINEISSS